MAVRGEWYSTGTVLWGGKVPVETGYIRSVERGLPIKASKGGEQTRYIGAIGEKLRDNKLSAHTTDILTFEMLHQSGGRYSGKNYGDVSLLKDVNYVRHDTARDFEFAFGLQDPIAALRSYLEQSNDCLFRKVKSELDKVSKPEKNSQDAWHLKCAMELDVDLFLTCDTRLIGQIKSMTDVSLKISLSERVVLPRSFCESVGLLPLQDTEMQALTSRLSAFPSR